MRAFSKTAILNGSCGLLAIALSIAVATQARALSVGLHAVERVVTPAKVQIGRGNRTVKTEFIFHIETRSPDARVRIHTDIGIDSGEEST